MNAIRPVSSATLCAKTKSTRLGPRIRKCCKLMKDGCGDPVAGSVASPKQVNCWRTNMRGAYKAEPIAKALKISKRWRARSVCRGSKRVILCLIIITRAVTTCAVIQSNRWWMVPESELGEQVQKRYVNRKMSQPISLLRMYYGQTV